LRPGDRFFHKTGGTDEVSHDGGILKTAEGRTYAIAVYTGLPSNDAGDAKFGPFMQRIRQEL
jgi:beta-lactamase class A